MYSRKHSGNSKLHQHGDSFSNDGYNNDKTVPCSKLLTCFVLLCGVVALFAFLSQAVSKERSSSSTGFRTPSFGTQHVPAVVQYEDFPDINLQDVQAKAMALLKSGGSSEEVDAEEKVRAEQKLEEEQAEADFVQAQKQQAEEEASARKAAPQARDNQPVTLAHADLVENSLFEAKAQIAELAKMKYEGHVVMETDLTAQSKIRAAQSTIRKFMTLKYGPGPYYVKMKLEFPDSMMSGATGLKGSRASAIVRREEDILIELAPLEHVPYSVYMFLEHIVKGYKSGSFHRNAGHVLQAMVTVQDEAQRNHHERFAWQEYSPHYPHKKFTLGYAGRPSSNGAFYISTMDNVRNHGPASQGSKTEADSIIGRIFSGEDVVRRMTTQPNKGGNGFIKSPKDYIKIVSLELVQSQSQ